MVRGSMAVTNPTFVFDDDGKAYAYVAGKIVAAADNADELEEKLATLPPWLKDEDDEENEEEDEAKKPDHSSATHVRTPNGLKGTILGKQKGLWGDQVTIRLENGRIAKFDVTPESKMEWLVEKAAANTPYAELQAVLEEMPDGTKASLVARVKTLKELKQRVASMIMEADYVDQETLDDVSVQADHELHEVTDALAAMEDAEPYAPPAPFSTGVAEQAQVGRGDGSWLDQAAEEMVAEHEATDWDQMMSEGPEQFVAELETPVLEDAPYVTEQADQFVSSKTAGIEATAAASFRAQFLERVAEARKEELASRSEKTRIAKEAATEEFDGPAEGLFF
jgi:hypothetical protein